MVDGPLAFGCRAGAPAAAAFARIARPWTPHARREGWRLLPGFALGEGYLGHAPAPGDAAAAPLRRPPVLAHAPGATQTAAALRARPASPVHERGAGRTPRGPRCSCAWSPYEPGRSGDSSPGSGDFWMHGRTDMRWRCRDCASGLGRGRSEGERGAEPDLVGGFRARCRTNGPISHDGCRAPARRALEGIVVQPCCAGPSARAVEPIIGCGSTPRRRRMQVRCGAMPDKTCASSTGH